MKGDNRTRTCTEMATATITNGYGYSSPLLVHMSDDCYCVSVLQAHILGWLLLLILL